MFDGVLPRDGVEEGVGAGEDASAAGFVAGEGAFFEEEDAEAGAGEGECGGGACGSGAEDEDVVGGDREPGVNDG